MKPGFLVDHIADEHLLGHKNRLVKLFGADGSGLILDIESPCGPRALGASSRAVTVYQPDGRRSMEKALETEALARVHGYHRFASPPVPARPVVR